MTLDPQARAVLERIPAAEVDYDALPAAVIRAGFDALSADLPREPVAGVEDRTVPGPGGPVPVRVYRPEADAALPVLVYLHGGGFVTGSVESHDPLCRRLVRAAGCAVLSVDYRLAPEHPFPAAPDDAMAAVRWVAAHGAEAGLDPERVAVGGDSAGGNLAAVTALRCRDEGGPALRHQLLLYPVIDAARDTASYEENATGYLLTRDMMAWFWRQYLPDPAAVGPLACPIRAASLAGTPPATVITAGYDPLRDEGEAYAARLRAEGVPTVLERFDDLIHGFLSFGGIDRADDALALAGRALHGGLAA